MSVRIRHRKDKNLWIVSVWQHGKHREYSRKDKTAAKYLAKQIEARLALGIMTPEEQKQQTTVREYFESWLTEHAEVNCRPSSVYMYRMAWKHYLGPALGDKKLIDVSRDDVSALVTSMSKLGRSRAYIKATIAPLSAAYTRALDNGLVTRNPVIRVVPMARQDKHRNVKPFTTEELSHLLATAEQEYPRYFDLLFLLSRTGLRIGEAVALQWGDLSFERNYLIVRRNYVKGIIGPPKGGLIRRVEFSQRLSDCLLDRFQPGHDPNALIFPSKHVGVLNPDTFRQGWYKLVKKANLERHNIKDLRHTYASLLIAAGVPLPYIQAQLGHHSIQVTIDTYGHLVPGGHQYKLDEIEQVLDDKQPAQIK